MSDFIHYGIQASILLIVFATGLSADGRHATYMFQNPSALGRMVLAMFVVMPGLALAMAFLFELHPAVKIVLVALALAPVPPIMPKSALKVSSATDYTIGVLVAASLLSIVFVPLAMELLHQALGRNLSMAPGLVAKQMFVGILGPLAAGMLVRRVAPSLAQKLAKPVSNVAFAVLVAGFLVILFAAHRAVVSLVGNGTVLAFVLFTAVGLTAGHLFGGPELEQRGVLAISTATRHPGMAIAIAHENYPEQKLAPAAVLLCLVLSVLVRALYTSWLNKSKKGGHAGGPGIRPLGA